MAAERPPQYIGEARQYARQIFNGILALRSLQAEWNALDYGNTLLDGTGTADGITADEVGAAVFATGDYLYAAVTGANGGHGTNLAALL